MKYQITINQAGIADAGLHETTDLADWAILEYIRDWMINPKATKIDDLVWINYKHLIKNMPLLGFKSKGALSNRMTRLAELGLINTTKDESGRLFAKVSEMYLEITSFRGDSHLSKPFSKLNGCSANKTEPFSKLNGGVQQTKHSVDNQTLENHNSDSDKKNDPEKPKLQWIVDQYNLLADKGNITECMMLTDARRKSINARIKDTLPTRDDWIAFFDAVQNSPFLMGKVPPRDGHKQFRLSLDFLVNPNRCVEICEGKYDG